MALLAFVDYVYLALFFIIMVSVVVLVLAQPRPSEVAAMKAATSVQKNKLSYGFVATLLLFFVVLTFVVGRKQPHSGSS